MEAATPQQERIATFVEDYRRKHGSGPSHREIADEFGFNSTNAVRSHIALMKKKGILDYTSGKARSLRVVGSLSVETVEPPAASIPLIGRIPAGIPFAALMETAERLPIAPDLFPGKTLFALRVEGQSMRDAGILNGDIAIINRQEDVADGQIAAVLLGDEDSTLKRFYRQNGAVVLRAANPDFEDIVVQPTDGRTVTIAGRLVGLLRTRYFVAA